EHRRTVHREQHLAHQSDQGILLTLPTDTQTRNGHGHPWYHPHTVIGLRGRASCHHVLRRVAKGMVYEPSDPGYEATVTPWNLAVQMRPDAVIAAADADDVAAAVRFASCGLAHRQPVTVGSHPRWPAAGFDEKPRRGDHPPWRMGSGLSRRE